jgi:hypothetical protein
MNTPSWAIHAPHRRRAPRGFDVGYDRLGVIGIVAMLGQATGAPDFSAACSGGSAASQ